MVRIRNPSSHFPPQKLRGYGTLYLVLMSLVQVQAVFRTRIRKFLVLPDSDPLFRFTDPDPAIIK
jgi:hypothetical protein